MADEMSEFVPTKFSNSKKNLATNYEHVKFIAHKPRKSVGKEKEGTSHLRNEEIKLPNVNTDLRKLRYEVLKFGSKAFDPSKKELSNVALAVALGAKPPKRKFENYKDILKAKKCETVKKPKSTLKKHLYVVGNKVIPAQPKTRDGSNRKLLDVYGKVNAKNKKNPSRKKKSTSK